MKQITGELALTFREKKSGQTYLAEQYFKLPLQVMAPHYQDDDGTAFIYLLNPSGGILQHDRLYTEINVEEGAKVVVTTPSATKFYKMDDGYAKIMNHINVKARGVMEYIPEHNVPFAESKVYQENVFYLDKSSVLIAADMVTAGRASMGEVFKYDVYSSKTRIYVEDKLKIYDNNLIEPGKMDLQTVGLMEDHLSNGVIYAYAQGLDKEIINKLNQLQHPEGIAFAAGMIEEDLLIIRFLGNNMIELKETIWKAWGCLREGILSKPAVKIRKY